MARKKKSETQLVALKQGHPTPYRRTLRPEGGEPLLMVLEPGTAYELDEFEVDCFQDLLDNGLLVRVSQEESGRLRYPKGQIMGDSVDTINSLESKIEELAAENAELKAALAKHGIGGGDDEVAATDGQ